MGLLELDEDLEPEETWLDEAADFESEEVPTNEWVRVLQTTLPREGRAGPRTSSH